MLQNPLMMNYREQDDDFTEQERPDTSFLVILFSEVLYALFPRRQL